MKNILVIYFSWWKLNFVNLFEEEVSYKLIRKYLLKDYSYYLKNSAGTFNNFLSVETGNFSSCLLNILQLFSEVAVFLAISTLLIFYQTKITFYLIILIFLIALVSGFF